MSRRLNILTPEEVAEELQTTSEKVIGELEAGTLKGFQFAGEWRTTEEAVRAMIDSLSNETPNQVKTTIESESANNEESKGIPTVKQLASLQWNRTTFEHFWPTETEPEVYAEAYQITTQVRGKEVPLLIGFCNRKAAGMMNRRRAVVFLGKQENSVYPLVEFTGANEFDENGTMASVIRGDGRKQCRSHQPVPSGYDDMPLGIYNQIVNGPYASGSRCVIAHNTDFAVMARHALLRAEQKEWL